MTKFMQIALSGAAMFLGVAVLPTASAEDPSLLPRSKMELLEPLVGRWEVDREQTLDGGESWRTIPAMLVDVRYRNKGLLLEETSVDVDDPSFHVLSFVTFDQFQDVFRQAVAEDHWGMMDISEGELTDGLLVVDNLESQTFYPMGESGLRALRISHQISSPERVVYIDESYDQGTSWSPLFRFNYTLVSPTDIAPEKADD